MWIWTLVHSSKTEVNLNQRQKQWRNLRAGYFKSEKIHHELIVVDHTIKRAQAVNAPGRSGKAQSIREMVLACVVFRVSLVGSSRAAASGNVPQPTLKWRRAKSPIVADRDRCWRDRVCPVAVDHTGH
jgi:hypothetical protein